MEIYCTECGAPMDADAGYCINCGARAQAAGAPPEPSPVHAPTPVSATPIPAPSPARVAHRKPARNSLLKLVAIAMAIFIVAGTLGIIGSIYVVRRITRSVATAVRNHGGDIPSLPVPFTRHSRLPDPCSLLRTDEAAGMLGIAIHDMEKHGKTCRYCPAPAEPDDECSANLTIEVNENGKAQMIAVKLAARALGSEKLPAELSRAVDDAVLSPSDSTLVFTKKGLGVRVSVSHASPSRDRSAVAVALAERIASRL